MPNLFIFDLDGTLYKFDNGNSSRFTDSKFYSDIKKKVYSFFVQRLSISEEQAIAEYERIKELYKGEVSLGVEKEFGIDRYEYFANTWNLNPADYLDKRLFRKQFLKISGLCAILTGAPGVWANRVLNYLDISDYFNGNVFTGEPDLRKPNPEVFRQIADKFGISYGNCYSIGDQEQTDIVPAKSIGMKTVIIGKSRFADYEFDSIEEVLKFLGGIKWKK